ncbi:hypothetical protein QR680_006028 [Steinernema hermaphroditum]|uniref:BPTI/Kunitz inhibitor domain-containing protein n=1 Tax=Steinernema hermaphroditum TaxID=289476 RepID=A0AA39LWP0_9BILA|nr:hypothetical protein QR680_006028 [Steinernema hermaphroditum]
MSSSPAGALEWTTHRAIRKNSDFERLRAAPPLRSPSGPRLSPEYKRRSFGQSAHHSSQPPSLDRPPLPSPTIMHIRTVLFVGLLAIGAIHSQRVEWCDYWRRIGKLHEHPECTRGIDVETTTTLKPELAVCTLHSALIQCTADRETCPRSGQVCTQSDGTMCCQSVTDGIPVSHINAKPGSCPPPLGISVLQDSTVGCWLDSNCPGIQKCCLEPNAVTNSATRICRDPTGIPGDSVCNLPLAVGSCTAPSVRFYYDASSGKCNAFTYSGCGGNANNFQSLSSCEATCHSSGIRGTPACPADANTGLNCLFAHADACQTDADCLGRENTAQPSCCRTTCGYRICYQY